MNHRFQVNDGEWVDEPDDEDTIRAVSAYDGSVPSSERRVWTFSVDDGVAQFEQMQQGGFATDSATPPEDVVTAIEDIGLVYQ